MVCALVWHNPLDIVASGLQTVFASAAVDSHTSNAGETITGGDLSETGQDKEQIRVCIPHTLQMMGTPRHQQNAALTLELTEELKKAQRKTGNGRTPGTSAPATPSHPLS